MANLTSLVARVRQLIDEPTQQNFTDTNITYAINLGQQEVAKEIVHIYEDYFETGVVLLPNNTPPGTVPGQELYTLPNDFLKFKRIERTDTGELLPAIDLNEKVNYVGALIPLTISGVELSYYVSGNNVGFTPTPTSNIPILMTYIYRLPDLTNVTPGSTDISQLPLEYHDMMAIYSAIQMFIQDESDTSRLDQMWSEQLDRLRRTMRQRQVQEPKHVRRTDSGYGVLY